LPENPPTASRAAPTAVLFALLAAACGVTGILLCSPWLLFPYTLFALLALACAAVGWRHRARSGLAVAAVLVVGFFAGAMLFTETRRSRETADRMAAADRLKRLSIAVLEYYEKHGRLPPAAMRDGGKALLSWRVAVLPFLGYQSLYDRFKLDEPWDSPHNHALLAEMPDEYAAPHRPDVPPHQTVFQVFVGPGTLFDPASPPPLPPVDFPGGPRELLMIVEAAQPVLWTSPEDLPYSADEPLPPLGSVRKYLLPPILFIPTPGRGMLASDAAAGLHWMDLDAPDEPSLRRAIAQDGE
jgi:hypothetical protein